MVSDKNARINTREAKNINFTVSNAVSNKVLYEHSSHSSYANKWVFTSTHRQLDRIGQRNIAAVLTCRRCGTPTSATFSWTSLAWFFRGCWLKEVSCWLFLCPKMWPRTTLFLPIGFPALLRVLFIVGQ